MTKYTLLVENKTFRAGSALFPIRNGPMFMLFVIGVTIGVTFALMYTQYQSMAGSRSHQLHLDRLSMLADDEIMRMHSIAPLNENTTKHSQIIDDAHSHENRSLAAKLFQEVRILCMVLTTAKNHRTRAIHIKRTWGQRCNKLIFVSNRPDKSLDSISLNVTVDNPSMTWGKIKRAFQYVYQHHRDDADWFLKIDDDSYVIVENLRFLLNAYSTNDPIYFGYKMNRPDMVKHGYFSGAGYALSKNALNRFSDALSHRSSREIPNCALNTDKGVEDLELGKCRKFTTLVSFLVLN